MTDRAREKRAGRAQLAAALEDVKPYAMAAGAVSLLGTPAEFGVPIARRLRGKSGLSLGPGLMSLVNGAVAVGVVHLFRGRPALWQRWRPRFTTRGAYLVGLAYLTMSLVTAGNCERTVILPRRSPLWAGLISPIGLLQIALLMSAFYRARRARLSDDAGASDSGVTPSTAQKRGVSSRPESAPGDPGEDGSGAAS
jgi:hypothetical protein